MVGAEPGLGVYSLLQAPQHFLSPLPPPPHRATCITPCPSAQPGCPAPPCFRGAREHLGHSELLAGLSQATVLWPGRFLDWCHPGSRRPGSRKRELIWPPPPHAFPHPVRPDPDHRGLKSSPLSQAPAVTLFPPSPQASILTRNGQVSHCSAGWPSPHKAKTCSLVL